MSFLLQQTFIRRSAGTLLYSSRNTTPWICENAASRRGYEASLASHLSEPNKRRRRRKVTSNKPSYRFVDKTRVRAQGGRGGKGSLSQEMIPRKHHLRPDGGHGGNGGSVILVADPREQSLKWKNPHVQAEKGSNGTSKEQVGRNGNNLILRVPCGVIVRKIVMPENEDNYDFDPAEHDEDGDDEEESGSDEEQENGDVDSASWNVHSNSKNNQGVEFFALDEEDTMDEGGIIDDDDDDDDDEQDDSLPIHDGRQLVYLADLDKPGAHIVVAQGGRGGRGTMLYRSKHGPLPDDDILVRRAQADPGEVAFLELELKSIADIGLVGYPNAGKSSILRAMSRATPAVAPYPFTTLHPLMGVIEYRDGMKIKVADIPGLIAGAAQGRGKGIDFLRHIERTKALCYVLDVAGTEGRDPHEDLRVLVDELSSYADGTLLDRHALVVANKVDLIEPERLPALLASVQETADSLGIERWSAVAGISAGVSGEGLPSFSKEIRSIVEHHESVAENAF